MVSPLESKLTGPGWRPGLGHCVVFLGKTLYSHSVSLHQGVQMGTSKNVPKFSAIFHLIVENYLNYDFATNKDTEELNQN